MSHKTDIVWHYIDDDIFPINKQILGVHIIYVIISLSALIGPVEFQYKY